MSCLAKSPHDRPTSAKELRGKVLACTDAKSWNEARSDDWWEQRRSRIRERRSARSVSGSPGVLTTRVAESLPDAQVA